MCNGGVSETVEDRRRKGWGKVAALLGVLGEVDMGSHRVEIGLLMRKAILVSSLLWSFRGMVGHKGKGSETFGTS